jgi:hypothetical protein
MTAESNEYRPNFILVKTVTPAEAVSLLVDRFPFMLDLGESLEELKETGPFYTYVLFGEQVKRKQNDAAFLRLVSGFIDELAASNDWLLEEVLVVSLLEKLAEDPGLAAKLDVLISEKARGWLKDVERVIYKRIDQRPPVM